MVLREYFKHVKIHLFIILYGSKTYATPKTSNNIYDDDDFPNFYTFQFCDFLRDSCKCLFNFLSNMLSKLQVVEQPKFYIYYNNMYNAFF